MIARPGSAFKVAMLCCSSRVPWHQLTLWAQTAWLEGPSESLVSDAYESLLLAADWQAYMAEVAQRGEQRIHPLSSSQSGTKQCCYPSVAPSSCNAFWFPSYRWRHEHARYRTLNPDRKLQTSKDNNQQKIRIQKNWTQGYRSSNELYTRLSDWKKDWNKIHSDSDHWYIQSNQKFLLYFIQKKVVVSLSSNHADLCSTNALRNLLSALIYSELSNRSRGLIHLVRKRGSAAGCRDGLRVASLATDLTILVNRSMASSMSWLVLLQSISSTIRYPLLFWDIISCWEIKYNIFLQMWA